VPQSDHACVVSAGNWHARLIAPRTGPALHWWSIEGFEFNELHLGLETLPDALAGVRLLHIADLHLRSSWPRGLDALVDRVKKDPPDLILYGGDQAHNMHRLGPSLPHIERLVKELPSRCGALAVLGNHDGDLLGPKMARWGVNVIEHRRVEIAVNGATIEMIGFPGPERADVDLHFVESMPQKRAGVPRIVLSHYPDLIRYARRMKPDLFLAGHTHGGQICLPGGMPIIRHDSLPRKYSRGLHNYKDVCLFVNRGMGFSSPLQVRLFSTAEVVEVRLGRMGVDK